MSEPLTPAPETPAPSTPPAEPGGKQSPERLPDDHPLVTALAAQKAKNADLLKQIDGMKVNDQKPQNDPGLADRIAALEQQIADKDAALAAAETNALRARLAAKLPADLHGLITGTTEEEITAQVETLAQHIKTGPTPNPQQGTPPGNTGGSLASGRDRYKASHS